MPLAPALLGTRLLELVTLLLEPLYQNINLIRADKYDVIICAIDWLSNQDTLFV